MIILIIYIIGAILSLSLYLSLGIKKGVITMSDLSFLIVVTISSWVGVVFYLLIYIDFENIII